MFGFENKKFSNLKKWKIDKIVFKDNGIISKLEFYNYINKNDVLKIIKYLKTKEFRYCKDKSKFNTIFNIVLKEDGEYISRNKYNKQNWDYINNKYLGNQDIKKNIVIINENEFNDYKYFYYVDFCDVLQHRGSNFLIKIYRNACQLSNYSKIEITYGIKKNNYNLFFGDWANKMKGISEIINKLTRKINYRFDILNSINDFSGKIDIEYQINEIMNSYSEEKRNKINELLR